MKWFSVIVLCLNIVWFHSLMAMDKTSLNQQLEQYHDPQTKQFKYAQLFWAKKSPDSFTPKEYKKYATTLMKKQMIFINPIELAMLRRDKQAVQKMAQEVKSYQCFQLRHYLKKRYLEAKDDLDEAKHLKKKTIEAHQKELDRYSVIFEIIEKREQELQIGSILVQLHKKGNS